MGGAYSTFLLSFNIHKVQMRMDDKVSVNHPGEGGEYQAPVLCYCSVSKHSLDGAEGTDPGGRQGHVDLQRTTNPTCC